MTTKTVAIMNAPARPTWAKPFVTNGPMIEFDVAGVGPGGLVDGGSVDYSGAVRSAVPFERVEILVNGEIVATSEGLSEPGLVRFGGSVTLPDGGWVAARAVGGSTRWPSMDSYPFAHTSPVWIGEVGSTDSESRTAAANDLLRALETARMRLEIGYGGAEIPLLTARFEAAKERLEALARNP